MVRNCNVKLLYYFKNWFSLWWGFGILCEARNYLDPKSTKCPWLFIKIRSNLLKVKGWNGSNKENRLFLMERI